MFTKKIGGNTNFTMFNPMHLPDTIKAVQEKEVSSSE